VGSANQSQAGLKMPGEFSDSRTAGIGREYKGAPPMFKQAHAKTKRSRNDLETIIAALPATPLDNGRNPSSRAIPCGLRMEFRGSESTVVAGLSGWGRWVVAHRLWNTQLSRRRFWPSGRMAFRKRGLWFCGRWRIDSCRYLCPFVIECS